MTTVIKRSKWQIWRDVIFALFAREIRTGFNDKLGISWAVVQPVLFILALSFFRGRLDGGETHGIPTFVFMAYGMLTIQMFLQTFNAGAQSIRKNRSLFAFRQVQPLSALIACGLFELLVKVFVIVGLVVAMLFMNMEIKVSNPLAIIIYFLAIWLFSLCFGLIFGMFSLYIPEVEKVRNLISRPLFFISGVFFSLQDVPQEFWYLLDWNPILHAIELSRAAAYSQYGEVGVSKSFLFMVVLSTTFLSLFYYYGYWKQAISR